MTDDSNRFNWTSADLGAPKVDPEDKEALRRALVNPANLEARFDKHRGRIASGGQFGRAVRKARDDWE